MLDENINLVRTHNHLGYAPMERANPSACMDSLRKVLQDEINVDCFNAMRGIYKDVKETSKTIKDNFLRKPFVKEVNPLELQCEFWSEAWDEAKKFFMKKLLKGKEHLVSRNYTDNTVLLTPVPQQTYQPNTSVLGKHQLYSNQNSSPMLSSDIVNKRVKMVADQSSPRRSPSPARKKASRQGTPNQPKQHGSQYKPLKADAKKKIQEWNPDALTLETDFVMGTKANKALGLGATRGRIYMKHPELFKYSGDHEDKKWMVANQCMTATGGKNTFIMIAEEVTKLYNREYKDCQGTNPNELIFFKLPEFVLRKMRSAMRYDKMLRQHNQPPTGRPPKGCDSLAPQFGQKKNKAQRHQQMTSTVRIHQQTPNSAGTTYQQQHQYRHQQSPNMQLQQYQMSQQPGGHQIAQQSGQAAQFQFHQDMNKMDYNN